MTTPLHNHYTHNPLRPYYIPPGPETFDIPSSSSYSSPTPAPAPSIPSFNTSHVRESFSEFSDYGQDLLDSPSLGESVRNFTNQAILRYTSVLLSQPFDVAKTVLQCQYVPRKETGAGGKKKEAEREGEAFDDDSLSDESDDEVRYFATDVSPDESPSLRPQRRSSGVRKMTDRAGYVLEDRKDPDIARPDYQIKLVRDGAIGETLKGLWQKEGAWGIWKGTNATFIHDIATTTLESLTTSFLSALFSLPDASTLLDVSDSTHPLTTLLISLSASCITALLLSPLDIIRTKLILTPSSSKPRNLLPSLRALPSYTIPQSLILPTILHNLLPNAISLGTPYFLKTKLFLDPVVNATSFSFFSFVAAMGELAVKLPLETILRRAQIAEAKPEKTIVPVGRYAGVAGTAWVLLREEECGKWGIEGLYRGWRVGAWGNVGVLGLGFVGVREGGQAEF